MSESAIVDFYRGAGVDHRGRLLDDILRWDDQALEAVHDYIQWLFPLDEPSMFNRDAPLLSAADCEAFRRDAALTTNLRRAFDRMLAFYGFQSTQNGAVVRVDRSSHWSRRSAVWLNPGNHNHLRLTRILKSLMLLGQPRLARALYERLGEEAERAGSGRISAATLRYWQDAVR
jgi:opioid growth factor receptor-like protein